ncbi:DUF2249 domain-containing protein [Halobacterium jilantaiense]|uniref:Uncharacterized conserved protein, DUF2249 family n=1 Tax=Halobacterium jilantaiense TaxID=355548 RepID=A0A1I0MZ88_9EURY|nr:DUF2249 domain-containing protein [Halobacterium jilantaiense]SEV94137.1 Uncharacterized conserved protein, DUF2249 family [Halobacterium jilantaiense]
MQSAIDVTEIDRSERRERVFEALDDADAGESVVVIAEEDPHPTLRQYRVLRGVSVDVTDESEGDGEWTLRATKRDGEGGDGRPEFDVRNMPPRRRHTVLTETFDLLDSSEGFVLVNDHDPEPLYHELQSIHGDVVGWSYEREGPDEWRVELSRTGESDREDTGAEATFDVREIPKPDRHPTIHHRYRGLAAGDALDVVAPHEPKPLRREFEEQYGDFGWDVLDREPGEVRVRITKRPRAGEAGDRPSDDGVDLTVVRELDVRDRPPAQRHEAIFQAYENLDAGEGFVLVNDHDPKPLYHQFQSEAGPEFYWAYRAKDPGEFRVLVGKDADNAGEPVDPDGAEAPF